jgi:hypothetical protein
MVGWVGGQKVVSRPSATTSLSAEGKKCKQQQLTSNKAYNFKQLIACDVQDLTLGNVCE